jgi:phosphatidate cytidylyltransferase
MFAAIVAAIVWLDTQWLGIALGAVILTGAWEWGTLSGLRNPGAKFGYVAGMAVLALAAVNYLPAAALFALGCAWWALVAARILRGQPATLLQGRVSQGWLLAGPLTLIPATYTAARPLAQCFCCMR